jgi:hypothetical protein
MSQVFPEWLSYVSQKIDAEIFYKSKVSEIILENKSNVGVK